MKSLVKFLGPGILVGLIIGTCTKVPDSSGIKPELSPIVTIPDAPTNVSAAAQSSTGITLAWDSCAGALTYKIYCSATPGGTYVEITTVTKGPYSDVGLSPSTQYYYKISALNSAGESDYSLEVTARTQDPPAGAPGVPTSVSATAQSSASIEVSWTAVTGATSYQIFRSTASGSAYTQVGTSASSPFTDVGLTASTPYYYVVKAANSAGISGYSSEATATTSAPPVVAPGIPTGIGATAQSSASIAVSWTAVTGATSYQIFRSTTSGSAYAQVGTSASSPFTDVGLTASTPYYYVVKAVNSAGISGYSSEATATTSAPAVVAPGVPTGLGATAQSSTSIAVSWTTVTGATSYQIFRSTTSGSAYTQVGTSASSPFTDVGLTASTPYYYVVKAVNSAGISGYSSEATATTSAPPVVAPGAPTGVGATAQSSTSIAVTWTAVTGATSYTIFRSATSGGAYTQVGTSASSPFTDVGLTPSTPYYYVVKAVNSAGTSGYSSEATATTSAPPVVAPGAPTGVGATAQSSTSIAVSWTAVTGATSYTIFRSATSGGTYAQVGTSASSPYTDVGLTPSTAYFYEVKAINSAGTSGYSSEATATTSAPPVVAPGIPTGVGATAQSSTSIAVSWTAVTGATSYKVFRSPTSGSGYTQVGAPTSSPYTDVGLSASTPYYYVVKAVNSAGESGYSSEATATTSAPPVVAPGIPTGVGATAQSSTSIAVSWTAVTGATSYKVFRSATSGGTYAQVGTPASSPFTDVGLSPSTPYFYEVKAVNSAGESGYSSEVAATTQAPPVQAPTAPTVVTATAGDGKVTVSWSSVTGATSYNLYYTTGTSVTTATGTRVPNVSPAYIQSGLTNGTQYAFAVTAANSAGESNLSAVQLATPLPPLPSAPTIGSATAGNATVTVTWGTVAGATSYNLYYQSGTLVTIGSATKVTGATSGQTVQGLTNGTQYAFAVTAVNLAGESSLSAVQTATPLPPIPAAPVITSATPGDAKVTVSWGTVTGATSYNLYYQTGTTVTKGAATVVSPATSGLSVTGLTDGTQYAFAVTSVNIAGESGLSTVQTATPQIPIIAISGRIDAGGIGLAGAIVRLAISGQAAETDANGNYSISGGPAHNDTIKVTEPGYSIAKQAGYFATGTYNFTLTKTSTWNGDTISFWGDTSTYPKSSTGIVYVILNRTNSQFTDDKIFWSDQVGGTKISIATQSTFNATSSGRFYVWVAPNDSGSRYYDYIEYVASTGTLTWNGNTTRIDAWRLPTAVRMHCADGTDQTIGDSYQEFYQPRQSIFDEFTNEVPVEFAGLATHDFANIWAPSTSPVNYFNTGGPYANYFDAYENSVAAAQTGAPAVSSTFNIFAGTGAGMSSNPTYCSAINRHCGTLPQSAWTNPANYYTAAPCNYYSKFMHRRSLHNLCYGYTYDDVAGQSSLVSHNGVQYVIIAVGF